MWDLANYFLDFREKCWPQVVWFSLMMLNELLLGLAQLSNHRGCALNFLS